MSHKAQKDFCRGVRRKYYPWFWKANVLDVGSLDINGNNRYLFTRSIYNIWAYNLYLGIDIVLGKNVDIVGKAHEVIPKIPTKYCEYKTSRNYKPAMPIDIVISTEMLEHDRHWYSSLRAMYDILRPGGLFILTCAGQGRQEHGTTMMDASSSPGTLDYYCNITNDMFESCLPRTWFTDYKLQTVNTDLQFVGIKVGG